MNVTHRLGEYIKHKKMSAHGFETAAGLTKNVIQKPLKNGTSITLTTLSKISENFPDLNINWLLSGNGEMLNEENGNQSNEPALQSKTDRELEKQLLQVQQDLINCMKQNAELKESSAGVRRTSPA